MKRLTTQRGAGFALIVFWWGCGDSVSRHDAGAADGSTVVADSNSPDGLGQPADATVDMRGAEIDTGLIAPDAESGTFFRGPDGTSVLGAFRSPPTIVANGCGNVPNGLFEPPFAQCLEVSANQLLHGSAEVCFPSRLDFHARVVRCQDSLPTSPRSCLPEGSSAPQPDHYLFLYDSRCCQILRRTFRGPPQSVCGETTRFEGTFAGGVMVDSDEDLVPDLEDNCRSVVNIQQQDMDLDAVGDACDNCPNVANTDQADDNKDGIGNACDQSTTNPDAGASRD